MIIPFQRSWLRSPIFVGALVILAVTMWRDAVRQMREVKMRVELRDAIAELEDACTKVVSSRKKII